MLKVALDGWHSSCKHSVFLWPPIAITLSSSYCCHSIAVSYCRPQNAAVIAIGIVTIGSSSSIVTTVAITVAIAVSAIAVIAVIVNVTWTTFRIMLQEPRSNQGPRCYPSILYLPITYKLKTS
jgi:hypothetical protein